MSVPTSADVDVVRRAALMEYDTLNESPEGDFDGLTTLAAKALGVPRVVLALSDGTTLRVKSRHGAVADDDALALCRRVFNAEEAEAGDAAGFAAGVPLRTAEGLVLGALCAFDDAPRSHPPDVLDTLTLVAAQCVALLALRRSERLRRYKRVELDIFRRLFEFCNDLQVAFDPVGGMRRLNPAWEELLGWEREAILTMPSFALVHPDDRAYAIEQVKRQLSGERGTVRYENRLRHRDGRWIPIEWNATIVSGIIYATGRDLSVNRAKERALAESEARLRTLFDALDEGVVMQLASGEIVACNPAAERILGLTHDQLMGRTSIDPRWHCIHEDGSAFPGEQHPAMVTLRTGEATTHVVMGVHLPSGALTWINASARALRREGEAAPYAAFTSFRDITEERAAAALQAQLAQRARLTTMGTLAAGVGHEINNPLTATVANLEFALDALRDLTASAPSAPVDEIIAVLSDARQGAERVRKIVRGLQSLAYAEGPVVPTSLTAVVDASAHLAMHELRSRATLSVELAALPLVLGDEARLTQVVVNLLVNAAQAFRANDPTRQHVVVRAEVADGAVTLAVSDNGAGVAPAVLPHIFDPFFTTKPVGQGTGLGLSISLAIARNLGGDLTCESVEGEGATFRLRVPIAPPAVRSEAPAPVYPAPSSPSRRGRVLVVDDEEAVARVVVRVLQPEHDVVAFTDAREAWQCIEEGARFDVVLCDLAMPYLSGADLYERTRARDPDLAARFVFSSGGAPGEGLAAFLDGVPNERLDKPFSTKGLKDLVRRLVAAQP